MRTALDIPPGILTDSTSHAEAGRWIDASLVRFNDDGEAETIGGWESLTATLLSGVCRSAFPWTDNGAVLNIAFGTHSKLYVWEGGGLYDVTPFGAPARLGANPLSVTNLSPTVVVTHTAHGLSNGASVKVFGATAVGGITPNGTYTITVINANSYSYTFGSNATSTTTGGGTNVVVTPQSELAAGPIDGTGSAGYGTGAYGSGPYGQTPSTADYFPRTWSHGAWGQNLLSSPRGGGIYEWAGNTAARAVAVNGAPTRVTHMVVAPMNGGYQVFALGCEEEVSGVFNPACVRHSGVRDNTSWTTGANTTAREYILTGGGQIVAGRMVGPQLLVWTSDALFVGSFVGALAQPWRFDRLETNCGLIGPNAVAVVDQAAFWISPDRQFHTFGVTGIGTAISNPLRAEFAENLAASQGDKITASTIAEFGEVRWDYPDARDGYENSRYLALKIAGPVAGTWTKGIMARTAMVDAGPSPYPVGVTQAGRIYWHERGHSADGGALSWHIESADQMLGEDATMLVTGFWPDFKGQEGAVALTLTSRFKPNGAATVKGPYSIGAMDEKTDVRAKGRYFKLRFSGNSAPAAWRLGKAVFDVRPSSRR
jgi:hypothetical protein